MRGLGIAKGFDKSRTNGWFLSVRQSDGTRPKQYFESERERDKAFQAKLRDVRSVGADASTTISALDRQYLAEMQRLAEPTGLSYREVFQRGLETLDGAISVKKLTASQAAVTFYAEQKLRLSDKVISSRWEQEVRYLLDRFLKTHGARQLTLCNRKVLKTYIQSLKVGPQTRVNHARVLSFFFSWCVSEELLIRNPVPEQEGVDRIPTVFSNDQVLALFHRAITVYPELVPMLAVQWFAGLRPGASHHLQWEHIDFPRCRIHIHPMGNKLKQPDVVQDIPPTVFAVLAPFRQARGSISHSNHVKLTKALHHDLGYHGKGKDRWPEDVARHTFASNLLPLFNIDLKRLDAVLLHTTSEMTKKHYVLKNVAHEAAEAYFWHWLPNVGLADPATAA